MKDSQQLKSIKPLIVGASCMFPENTINTTGEYGGTYARFDDEVLLIDDSIREITKVLSVNNVSPDEIDMIVTTCFSSNSLAYEPDIGGPRLGHPIQKELKAQNAWVIDAADSSLSTTFDIVNSYLINNEKTYGLIVRAEKTLGMLPDEKTGFIWSDGVGVILVKNALIDPDVSLKSRLAKREMVNLFSGYQPCQIAWNQNLKNPEDHKGTLVFDYQAALVEDVNDFMNRSDANAIRESWIESGRISNNETFNMGPLRPYNHIANLKKKGDYSLYSFNPFRLELCTTAIEMSQ